MKEECVNKFCEIVCLKFTELRLWDPSKKRKEEVVGDGNVDLEDIDKNKSYGT